MNKFKILNKKITDNMKNKHFIEFLSALISGCAIGFILKAKQENGKDEFFTDRFDLNKIDPDKVLRAPKTFETVDKFGRHHRNTEN